MGYVDGHSNWTAYIQATPIMHGWFVDIFFLH